MWLTLSTDQLQVSIESNTWYLTGTYVHLNSLQDVYIYPLGCSLVVLANIHSCTSSIDHWKSSHDLLRLCNNFTFPNTWLLSKGKDTAHLKAILRPIVYP